MVTKTRIAATLGAVVSALIILALLQDQAIAVTANNVRAATTVYQFGDLDQKSVDRTLALLDKAITRTGAHWEASEGRLQIRVALHPDPQAMNEILRFNTHLDLTLKGFVECTPDGPVIHMPVHPNQPLLPDRPESQVANHEAVHAWLCQSVGAGAEHHIPLWLQEGMATNLQANRLEAFGLLQILKFNVRQNGPQTEDGIEFCYRLPNEGLTTYATTTLFVRHIDATWPQASTSIIAHIAAGYDFASAFEKVTLSTCEAAYESWTATR